MDSEHRAENKQRGQVSRAKLGDPARTVQEREKKQRGEAGPAEDECRRLGGNEPAEHTGQPEEQRGDVELNES